MSKYNQLIIVNSIFSILNMATMAVLYFFLYKLILPIIGLELFGLWSLIFAISSIAGIGNLGFAGAIIKYSAEIDLTKKFSRLNDILNSSIFIVIAAVVILGTAVLAFCHFYLQNFIEHKYLQLAFQIIPVTLTSILIAVMANLFFAVVEGFNRFYYKAIANIISFVFYFGLSVYWVEEKGIMGLAYANFVESVLNFLFSIIILIFIFPEFRIFRFKWRKYLIREVMDYGVKFQSIGIITMVFEPLIKSLLSKYAGLDFVGIYELANKLVVQVRSISSNIMLKLIPKIVQKNVQLPFKEFIGIYKRMNNINFILLWTLLISLLPFANMLSVFLLGEENQTFKQCLYILTISWMINSFNISAYTINIGTANLKWNNISHLIYGILSTLLLLYTGVRTGNGIIMIISSSIALIVSGIVLIIEFHKKYNIGIKDLINESLVKYAFFFLIFFGLSQIIYSHITNNFIQFLLLGISTFVYFVFNYLGIKEFRSNFNEIVKLLFGNKFFKND